MKKTTIFLGISIILAVLTIGTTIVSVSSSIELSSLNKKEARLLEEKKGLEEDLIKSTSSSKLAEISTGMGFEKISNVFYLSKVDVVAQAR